MKNEEKVYLLAEFFQVDMSSKIESTLKEIEKSESYKNLLEHVEIAKKYSIPDAEKFIQLYESLKFSKISTYRDALVTKATIDHLSFVSSPKYFINPFTFNEAEMQSGISNIGELPLTHLGKEYTLTSWFEDTNISTSDRIREVNHLVEKWSLSAKSVVLLPLQTLLGKNQTQKKTHLNPWGWVDFLICIIANGYFIFTLFSQSHLIFSLRTSDFHSISFWAYMIFIVFLFLYESWVILDFFNNRRDKSAQLDCISYLKNHLSHAFDTLENNTKKLHLDLLESIKNKKMMDHPLTRYNGLKNYRRIGAFLNMDHQVKIDKRTQDIFFYSKVSIMALLLLSTIFLSACIIVSFIRGGLI